MAPADGGCIHRREVGASNWRSSIDSRQLTSSVGASRKQSYATSAAMRVICTEDEDLTATPAGN